MKRSKRLALSALAVLISPVIALLSAIAAARMIPAPEIAPGIFEATPGHIGVALLAFVMMTGLCALLGLRGVWDRRFD